jgi:hypothetical protein
MGLCDWDEARTAFCPRRGAKKKKETPNFRLLPALIPALPALIPALIHPHTQPQHSISTLHRLKTVNHYLFPLP